MSKLGFRFRKRRDWVMRTYRGRRVQRGGLKCWTVNDDCEWWLQWWRYSVLRKGGREEMTLVKTVMAYTDREREKQDLPCQKTKSGSGGFVLNAEPVAIRRLRPRDWHRSFLQRRRIIVSSAKKKKGLGENGTFISVKKKRGLGRRASF